MRLQLAIGNKNYSSWSMRPWLILRHAGIDFEELMLRFDSFEVDSQFKQAAGKLSPTGKVPVLLVDGFPIWDTLAIAEFIAEQFPDRGLWPSDTFARARARTLCAEMHAGFGALRDAFPMNIEASLPDVGARLLAERPAVQRDLDRLVAMWSAQLETSGGPGLFGEVGIVDLYYAPVVNRLRCYAPPVPPVIRAYMDHVWALPAVQDWVRDALAEHDFLPFEEPYRQAR